MRILIVGEGPVPDVYRNYRADPLARYLSRAGHDITIICPQPPMFNREQIYPNYKGIKFFWTSPYRRLTKTTDMFLRAKQYLETAKRLWRCLQSAKYDFIRALSPGATYLSILGARRSGIPVLTNYSDCYSDLYRQFELPLSTILSPMIENTERSIRRSSTLVMVDSPAQRELWVRLGLEPNRCIVMPNGFYPERFDPMVSPETWRRKYNITGKKTILYHGDMSRIDGIDIIIESARFLLKNSENLVFLMVGSGLNNFMRRLMKRLSETGTADSFVFTGWVPHSEVQELLALATVCVAPSRISITTSANIPNKIIEYIAMRKPTAVTRTRGLLEMIGDSFMYVNPEDPKDLADKVLKILELSEISRLAKRATELAPLFEWERIMRQEEALYTAFLDDPATDLRKFDYIPAQILS